jgi:tetratricopeptide (TPR) repeat protein
VRAASEQERDMADLAELWDFDRPDVSEQRFRAALPAATGSDALVLRTQLARALGLQRRFAEAAAELDAVPDNGDPLVRTYRELERGRVLNSCGDPDAARPHFLAALAEAEAAGLDHLAADAAHMMAIVEPGEAQLPWAERALAIAGASTDPRARRWIGSVSHNLGWTLHGLGRHEEALAVWRRALAFREEQGDAGALHIAQWTVARGLRSLGRYEEALAIQRDLAARVDSDGYVPEELGELLLALGRPDEARPHFARAHALLSRDAWLVDNEPDRLARLAALGAGEPG